VEKRVDEALIDLRRTLYLNLVICAVITALVLLATRFTINRYQSRLESLATTDKLTGLASRHASDILLPQAIVDARRMTEPMAVVLLDIDGFKQVNDRHGHLIGDAVLRAVAEAAREAVRGADIICRWGGDEYLIVLRNCTLANALIIAERIRANVEAGRGAGGAPLPATTVSLGVAALGAGENEAGLLARADRALYQAKNAGRNRVILAEG
jgi:diguanylate cyclase (GGDEF)-like protein